jgi:hypothetical protein
MATFCSIAQIEKSYANGMGTESFSYTCSQMDNSEPGKHPITYSSSYKYYTYEWRSAGYFQGEPNFNIKRQVSVNASFFPIPILLYPNPPQGRKIELVMKDATATYEISVTDASGNIVRSYQGFRGSRLLISGLKNGNYQVRIKNLSTGKIFTDTLIMKE